jgi:hypothetical protein
VFTFHLVRFGYVVFLMGMMGLMLLIGTMGLVLLMGIVLLGS